MLKLIDCLEGLKELADNSINCIVTSPPYNKKGLQGRVKPNNQCWGKFNIDYATYGDDMPEADYQLWQQEILTECHRVLTPDGSLFYNHKPRRHRNRAHLPFEFIQHTPLTLYQLIIWNRRNSPNIRNDCLVPCTEHVYWLTKGKPYTDRPALPPEYKTEVWEIPPERQKDHPAPFPPTLVNNCILLSTRPGDTVLDPFMGSGTTALCANTLGRQWVGFEVDQYYYDMTHERLNNHALLPL